MNRFIYVSILILLFSSLNVNAQFLENFYDGELLHNPTWQGNLTSFAINSLGILQSNNSTPNHTFYIATQSSIVSSSKWEFSLILDFNPSSLNYVDVYLTSASSDQSSSSNTGYFVRIGNTLDEICLYSKHADGKISKIIDGVDGVLDKSKSWVKIKVTCDENYKWSLFRDITGLGNSYYKEGSAVDKTYQGSNYFGILIHQSTSSFFNKHFFDNISVEEYHPVVPLVVSVKPISLHTLDILFNKKMEISSSTVLSNYFVNNSIGNPSSITIDPLIPQMVHLSFKNPIPPDKETILSFQSIIDEDDNILNTEKTFTYHPSKKYDVVIDEIMPDPTPAVGLPNAEWIELRNNTLQEINLKDWKLRKALSQSEDFPDIIIEPNGYLIITAVKNKTILEKYGQVLCLNKFPSLINKGETISLLSPDNQIIYAVNYNLKSYQDIVKSKGGWSLEMGNVFNGCIKKENWKASIDITGGTPGRRNSLNESVPGEVKLKVVSVFCPDDLHLIIAFNKSIDSAEIFDLNNYIFSDNLIADSAVITSPLYDQVLIKLKNPITLNKKYQVTLKNIHDCEGNTINIPASFALAIHADTNDIVINEILFHPKINGGEYIELYNRSDKIIDVASLSFSNRNKLNQIDNIHPLSDEHRLIFPKEYLLISTDTALVLQQYITTNKDAFIEVDQLPSLPNDTGSIVLLSGTKIIDEVHYSDKWHLQLLNSTTGVSLERIDFNSPSIASNFTSASSTCGYGTPSYKNSQAGAQIDNTIISILPKIISPDNDGIDDVANINFQFKEPGNMVSINIYDVSGHLERQLLKNAYCGIDNNFIWDGFGENHKDLPIGIHVIASEIFNPVSGYKKIYKNAIVLARRIN